MKTIKNWEYKIKGKNLRRKMFLTFLPKIDGIDRNDAMPACGGFERRSRRPLVYLVRMKICISCHRIWNVFRWPAQWSTQFEQE